MILKKELRDSKPFGKKFPEKKEEIGFAYKHIDHHLRQFGAWSAIC